VPFPFPNLSDPMNVAVSFTGVSRHFGHVRAVDGVDLDIAEGEFFAMLGPSGSGKTTCLRLIAGFEQPTAGDIRLFGQSVRDLPPYRRAVNTVFQDYALFPHLNVRDNVAYGPMIAGKSRAERYREAEAALTMVALPGYGDRKPSQLSGGQRQRVALARAIVNRPRVLLLDEPLGALDLKLREAMQEELKALQRQLGITFVFVTHDQGEALSMADRVAVFNEGRLVQVGSPEDIYYRPEVPFVADFVGSSNVLPPALTGLATPAALRPEAVHLGPSGQPATVTAVNFLGAATRVTLDAQGTRVTALLPKGAARPAPGETVHLAWEPADLHPMKGAP
jgi:putative spermidine/putrescine transport system ATP-binding protein